MEKKLSCANKRRVMCSSTNECQEFHHQEDSCLNCETPSWSFSTLLTSDVATEDVIL